MKRRSARMLALPLFLLGALMAACGTGTTTPQANTRTGTGTGATASPTATATQTPLPQQTPAGPCPNKVMDTATVPPAPAPTPIAAANWTPYTNTSAHYTIQYPASWYVPDTSPTSTDFSLLNFDPRTYHPRGDNLPPPPYSKIEIRPLTQISEGKTPIEFYTANDTNNPLNPPECSRTTTQTTIAGHAALQIVQWPAASGYGPPAMYPMMYYYVATGSGQPLLSLTEFYSPGGGPSATFAQMIASLAFTG